MKIRILLVMLGALFLAGCASKSTPTASPASGPHNAADVAFATDMIPHHTQAIQMADLALQSATSPGVKAMAQTIKNAQDPEIVEMSGWLKTWGVAVASGSMSGMDDGPGMMSGADMASLGKATGAAFDRLWVQLMIQHHEGALAMAKTELAQGQNGGAQALATSIITSQSAQIDQLKAML